MQIEESDETPFKKILCANRGEIAVRVFRAGTELGLRTASDHCQDGAEGFHLQPCHKMSQVLQLTVCAVRLEKAQALYSSCATQLLKVSLAAHALPGVHVANTGVDTSRHPLSTLQQSASHPVMLHVQEAAQHELPPVLSIQPAVHLSQSLEHCKSWT